MSFADIVDQDQLKLRLAAFHEVFRNRAVRLQHLRLTRAWHTSAHGRFRMPRARITMHVMWLQGWDCFRSSEHAAVLATLVKLAQHEAGRSALVSAGVPRMVVEWVEVTLGELNSVTAEKQRKRVEMERKEQRDQQPLVAAAAQHSSAGKGCTHGAEEDEDTSAPDGTEATVPMATLQLLRLIRNLCAAGDDVTMHMTAFEVPAAVAIVMLDLDPQLAGESMLLLSEAWCAIVCIQSTPRAEATGSCTEAEALQFWVWSIRRH